MDIPKRATASKRHAKDTATNEIYRHPAIFLKHDWHAT
jgi:hypothetical protein